MIKGKSFIEYLESEGKTEEYSWEQLASIYGFISANAARNVWRRFKDAKGLGRIKTTLVDKLQGRDTVKEAVTACYISELEEIIINHEAGTAKASFVCTSETLSDEEIYKECKMDGTKWLLTQVWHKKRFSGFVYSANFKLIPQNSPEKVEEAFSNVLLNYNTGHQPLSLTQLTLNNNYSSPTCVFIAITDIHFDKQTIDGQSLEFKIAQYHKVLETLLFKSYSSNLIEEIVFTIGHDMFNTDTYFKTTTNGTQQFNNSNFDDSYEAVFDSQVKAINKLKQFCNTLHIKYIPSNHARTKEYFLVHALSLYFKGDKNIIFDRSTEPTKVHVFGENFIGMHHGDTKLERLPSYFSQKYYKEWGMAKYKSIFVGDKHTRKSWNTESTEIEGVRVTMTPHMGGYGDWDKLKMFDNGIQSGICTIFNKTKGRCMEIEEII